eukprot:EC791782.1.p1 GENE.EC791782.1~~EC791782.1.p1  ORF type:complete len:96 (+),score=21.64 EC791782.1:3-290(+)
MRAFQAAKAAYRGKSRRGDDYVQRVEFGLLLRYLREYFELYEMFARMDTSHDRRIAPDAAARCHAAAVCVGIARHQIGRRGLQGDRHQRRWLYSL